MDVVAQRVLLRYPVSVPLEEVEDQEEDEGERDENDGDVLSPISTSQPHRQQTSLPDTIQAPMRPPNLHTQSSPDHSTSSPNGDDAPSNNRDVIDPTNVDGITRTNNYAPDLNNGDSHDPPPPHSGSSSQNQNVLHAEVVIYLITIIIQMLTAS